MRRYQPFYCEENVWWLLRELTEATEPSEASEAYAVFVTNAERAVAVWQQRAAPPGEPVIWDYHVIAIAAGAVWDLDSRLGSPVPLDRYLAATFLPVDPALAPWFRVVPAALFHARFASDRSHMRVAGGWLRPPPPWPPLHPAGVPMNLMRFVDLTDPIAGEVVDVMALRRRFGVPG